MISSKCQYCSGKGTFLKDVPWHTPQGGVGGVVSLVPFFGGSFFAKKTFLSGIKFLIELYYQIFDFFWHFFRKFFLRNFFLCKLHYAYRKIIPRFRILKSKKWIFSKSSRYRPKHAYIEMILSLNLIHTQKDLSWKSF